jgi:hypothetical protein
MTRVAKKPGSGSALTKYAGPGSAVNLMRIHITGTHGIINIMARSIRIKNIKYGFGYYKSFWIEPDPIPDPQDW